MCNMRSVHPLAILTTLTTLLLADFQAGQSQESAPVGIGSRVRVRVEGTGQPWVVGQLLALSDDSVRLRAEGPSDSMALGIPSLAKFEVSRGRRGQAGRGAKLGAAVGGVAGLILGAATYEECDGCIAPDPGRGGTALLGGVLGAAFGLGIGALIGRGVQAEQWAPVPRPWSAEAAKGERHSAIPLIAAGTRDNRAHHVRCK